MTSRSIAAGQRRLLFPIAAPPAQQGRTACDPPRQRRSRGACSVGRLPLPRRARLAAALRRMRRSDEEGNRRHRRQAARFGRRRHPAREHARRARRPGDRRNQHQRIARRASRRRSAAARAAAASRPVLLLNGQRISSFRELRDIPTEAIQRVEILPEEVALKYGYSADQKVVNIVLRQRFRSTVAQLGAGVATDGGYATGNADLTRLLIQKNGRTQVNLHAEGNTHADRGGARHPSGGAGAVGTAIKRSPRARWSATKRDLRGSVDRQPAGARRRFGDAQHRGRAYRGPFADRPRQRHCFEPLAPHTRTATPPMPG